MSYLAVNFPLEAATPFIKETLRYIGLDQFEAEIIQIQNYAKAQNDLLLSLKCPLTTFDKPLEMNMTDYAQTVMAPLIQAVENSELVLVSKTDLLSIKADLEKKNRELQEKLDHYKEYEIYYRLAKGLNGK